MIFLILKFIQRNITTIKQFVATKDADRRSILRYLTDEQYDDIMRVCEYYPHVEMLIKSEVYDDEDAHTITAGAIVTLTVTLKRQNLVVLFDKETPVVEDKQQILAIDDQQNGDGETNGELVEKPATDDAAKVNNKSTAKQPWEKQKKKPKYAKAKPKSKSKVINKVVVNNTSATTNNNKKVDSSNADSNKIEVDVNFNFFIFKNYFPICLLFFHRNQNKKMKAQIKMKMKMMMIMNLIIIIIKVKSHSAIF